MESPSIKYNLSMPRSHIGSIEVVPQHPGFEVSDGQPYAQPQSYSRPQQSYAAIPTITPPPVQDPNFISPQDSYPPHEHYQPYQVSADSYFESQQSTTAYKGVHSSSQSQFLSDPYSEPSKPRRGWILPALVGIVVAVVVGAAVGGGLGATLQTCENNVQRLQSQLLTNPTGGLQSPNGPFSTKTVSTQVTTITDSASTSDATAYRPAAPADVPLLASDACKDGEFKLSTNYKGVKFSLVCNRDIYNGMQTTSSGAEIQVSDIVGLVAYSLQDCIDACASFSGFAAFPGQSCAGISWRTGLQGAYRGFEGANCWLKNGTGTAKNFMECADCTTAVIV